MSTYLDVLVPGFDEGYALGPSQQECQKEDENNIYDHSDELKLINCKWLIVIIIHLSLHLCSAFMVVKFIENRSWITQTLNE